MNVRTRTTTVGVLLAASGISAADDKGHEPTAGTVLPPIRRELH